MAAPIIEEVVFDKNLPTMDVIIDDLITVSGLLIEFDSWPGGNDGSMIWEIKAVSTKMNVLIVEEAHLYTIVCSPLSKAAPYLAGTLRCILAKYGGHCNKDVPNWAGQPWEEVRQSWKPDYLKLF